MSPLTGSSTLSREQPSEAEAAVAPPGPGSAPAPAFIRHLLLLALVVPLYLQGLGQHGLTYPEESLKNELARSMAETGDWIVPRLNGQPNLTKPPLVIWATTASFKLFGVSEWAARFPSACFGLATVLALYFLAATLFDRRTALIAAGGFALTLGPFHWSRSQAYDPALTCLVTWSLAAFTRCLRRPEAGARWAALGYGAAAAATLVKGPIGLLIPVMVLGLCALATRSVRETARRLRVGPGLLFYAALVLPWFLAAEARCPGSFANFILNESVNRFLKVKYPVDYRSRSIPEFVGMYGVFLLPLSLVLPAAAVWAAQRWRGWTEDERQGWRLGGLWAAAVLGFFCLSKGRLVGYSYPAMPPVALLVGRVLAGAVSEGRGGMRWTIGGILIALGALPAGGLLALSQVLDFFGADRLPGVEDAVRTYCCGGLAVGACLGAAAWLARRPRFALAAAAGGLVLMLYGVAQAHALGSVNSTYRQVGLHLRRTPDLEQARVVILRPRELGVVGGLNFYARHPVQILLLPGEPDFAQEAPDRAALYLDLNRLALAWLTQRVYLVVADHEDAEAMARRVPGEAAFLGPFGRFWIVTQREWRDPLACLAEVVRSF